MNFFYFFQTRFGLFFYLAFPLPDVKRTRKTVANPQRSNNKKASLPPSLPNDPWREELPLILQELSRKRKSMEPAAAQMLVTVIATLLEDNPSWYLSKAVTFACRLTHVRPQIGYYWWNMYLEQRDLSVFSPSKPR